MLDLRVAVICSMEKPGGGVGDLSDTAAGFELARFRLPSMTRILPGGTVKHHPPIGTTGSPALPKPLTVGDDLAAVAERPPRHERARLQEPG
nr:hypothetical protein GCM10020063_091950 [Dactylosporangium thailandense]